MLIAVYDRGLLQRSHDLLVGVCFRYLILRKVLASLCVACRYSSALAQSLRHKATEEDDRNDGQPHRTGQTEDVPKAFHQELTKEVAHSSPQSKRGCRQAHYYEIG